MAFPGTSDTPATAAGASAPGAPTDWPIQATDTIVRVVDTVREKTTGPALDAARWLIYGLVLAILAVPVLLLVLVAMFRLLEGFLLWVHDRAGWASFLHDPIGFVYLAFGLALTAAGLLSWRKGKRPAPAP